MEVGLGYLWLIPVSLISCGLLQLLLERILVKWICRSFLYDRVQLMSCGNHQQKLKDESRSESVGEARLKIITPGDMVELSLQVMTFLMGVATSAVSVVVILETMHDSLNARSVVLTPWVHIAVWYYVIDTSAMYRAFTLKKNIIHRKTKTKLILFCQAKWFYLFHHFILIVIAYPMLVNASLRGYKGDFFAAFLLALDFSNPFLALAKILRTVGLSNTWFYAVNGGVLIMVFLIARLLNVPIAILVYTAQYHEWNVMKALATMRWMCHTGNLIQFLFMLNWFIRLLLVARNVIRGWFTADAEKIKPKESRTGILQEEKKLN